MYPLEYEYEIYVGRLENGDLAQLNKESAALHYEKYGISEGRICSKIKSRSDFIALIDKNTSILEIGPFFTPAFRRTDSNVNYLDCAPTEQLKKAAANIAGAKVDDIPEIDYVWSGTKYSEIIKKKYEIVYSSHNIEHQPCFISHF